MACGFLQGSVLKPMLWSLFYDNLLRLNLSSGMSVVIYVNDVAVVATAHNALLVEEVLNLALELVTGWLAHSGLRLAAERQRL